MPLRQQIEAVVGREIPTRYLSEMLEGYEGRSSKEAFELLDMHSQVVSMTGVLTGRDKPAGPLVFIVSEHRGGFLIQLREGLKKT